MSHALDNEVKNKIAERVDELNEKFMNQAEDAQWAKFYRAIIIHALKRSGEYRPREIEEFNKQPSIMLEEHVAFNPKISAEITAMFQSICERLALREQRNGPTAEENLATELTTLLIANYPLRQQAAPGR